jgi:hypothetical protein
MDSHKVWLIGGMAIVVLFLGIVGYTLMNGENIAGQASGFQFGAGSVPNAGGSGVAAGANVLDNKLNQPAAELVSGVKSTNTDISGLLLNPQNNIQEITPGTVGGGVASSQGGSVASGVQLPGAGSGFIPQLVDPGNILDSVESDVCENDFVATFSSGVQSGLDLQCGVNNLKKCNSNEGLDDVYVVDDEDSKFDVVCANYNTGKQ